jgi:hypothetical protein
MERLLFVTISLKAGLAAACCLLMTGKKKPRVQK